MTRAAACFGLLALLALATPARAEEGTIEFQAIGGSCPQENQAVTWRNPTALTLCVGASIEFTGVEGAGELSVGVFRGHDAAIILGRTGDVVAQERLFSSTTVPIGPGQEVMVLAGCFVGPAHHHNAPSPGWTVAVSLPWTTDCEPSR